MTTARIPTLISQACAARGWPTQLQTDGTIQTEIPTQPGRSQVVTMTMAKDGDGDAAAFIWSKGADVDAIADPWLLMRKNAVLTYGRFALRGTEVIVLHALNDAAADLIEVGKALYWVARAADDLEQGVYGIQTDVL